MENLPAVDPLQGLAIEVVDKNMAVPEQVKAKISLLSDFTKVQHAITPAKKNATAGKGSKFSYKYATLDEVLKAIIDASKKFDFGFWQKPVRYGNAIGVINYVFNGAGAIINFGAFLLPAGRTAQDAGSALTYSKRYSISSIFGLASEEDEDGKQSQQPTQQAKYLSPQQLEQYEVQYPAKLADIYDEAVNGVKEAQDWIRKQRHDPQTVGAIKQLDKKYMDAKKAREEADRKAKEKAEKEAHEEAAKQKALSKIQSTTKEKEVADPFPEAKTEVKDDDISSLFQPEEVK